MATATAALQRVRGSSLIDIIGLLLLATVIVWLFVKFVEDPTRFLNVMIIGVTNGAIYFHTRAIRPGWSRRMARTTTIGHHIFYRAPIQVAGG